jgi:hypothetical protein
MGSRPDGEAPGRRRRTPTTMPTVSLRRTPSGRPRLETALMRRSMDDSVAAQHRCAHCRRTPLVGELVHVYLAGEEEERLVCALCRPMRREPPAETRLMHTPDHERSVRVRERAA